MLNPHHLELFYHVACHGGISRALRHIPYGIQQPAVSGQILLLEQDLGVKLFLRAPFRLTPEGQVLLAFVRPFFENLDKVEASIRAGLAPVLRIGAAEPVLCDHLPSVLTALRRGQPRLQLHLRSGYQAQLESWLLEHQIDLAVTALESRPPSNLRRRLLVRLPLVLLVPRGSPVRTESEFWDHFDPRAALVSLPETEAVSRHFRRGLERRRLTWAPTIIASSLEAVARYVAGGYGIGVSVSGATRQPSVRSIALNGFPSIEIVALWTGRMSPIVQEALGAMRTYTEEKWPHSAID